MSPILYSIVGHVWSWLLVWMLSLAALMPHTRLSIWTFGVSLGAPLSTLLLCSQTRAYDDVVLTMCGIALLWLVLALRYRVAADYTLEVEKDNTSIFWPSIAPQSKGVIPTKARIQTIGNCRAKIRCGIIVP
jgi:glycopeptide antibiotics resistance protein